MIILELFCIAPASNYSAKSSPVQPIAEDNHTSMPVLFESWRVDGSFTNMMRKRREQYEELMKEDQENPQQTIRSMYPSVNT